MDKNRLAILKIRIYFARAMVVNCLRATFIVNVSRIISPHTIILSSLRSYSARVNVFQS